jgi:halimadienyl-diphosphate synthase
MDLFRGLDLVAEIRDLVSDLVADRVAIGVPSVYETGRLVTLAPWLDGHARRIRFLLDEQHPDGSWGGPGGYAVVPTLSAVEALMTVLDRDEQDSGGNHDNRDGLDHEDGRAGHRGDAGGGAAAPRRALRAAVERGRGAAAVLLHDVAAAGPPPTAGAAMVIAALTEAIARRTDAQATDAQATDAQATDAQGGAGRPPQPAVAAGGARQLATLRGGGWRIPLLSHYLELAGPGVAGTPEIQPVDGSVCGSAAATAAWLGPVRPSGDPAGSAAALPGVPETIRMLTGLQARYGGPVPAFTSQVFVARAWSLAHLALAGVDGAVLAALRDVLAAALGPDGLPGGLGLPADSDTTAVALFALAQLGEPRRPDHLWEYDAGTHFVTVRPETEASTSANAHILMALGDHAARGGPAAARCAATAARIAAWLGDRQRADGSWLDKWHASPFYATRSCALALDRYGGPEHATAVDRAVRWVLAGQRVDGSWGRPRPTVEETAYAVQTLLHAGPRRSRAVARAAAHGCRHLIGGRYGRPEGRHPPLFHGKDLVSIPGLVRAAVLAALVLAQRNRDVAALLDGT